jgi:hypothetical protein
MPSLVKPEYGPPLTALLRERARVPAAATIVLLAALVVAGGLVMLFVRPGDEGDQLIHEGDPVFNVLYRPDDLRQATPRGDELLRLEGARGRQSVAVTVRPLGLPDVRGDVTHAFLPVYATAHLEQLRRVYPGFRLLNEGRARVNNAPGYEVAFQAGLPGGRTYGSDVLVVPGEDETAGALVLSLRRRVIGRLGAAGHELTASARKAFRSFRYGRDRS